MTWRILDPEEVQKCSPVVYSNRLHCEGCGRFVKPGKYERYYNGRFNCVRTHYMCSLCGPGAIEHV